MIAEIRESPEEFNAPAIIDFEKPIFGKSSWAVNKTNMKMLIKLYGDDETKLVGKKNQAGGDQGPQPANRRARVEPSGR